MIDFKIDTSVGGTWDLVQGDDLEWEMVEEADEVAQRCAVAARTHLGESTYDTDQGLPWFGEILVKGPNIPSITDRFRVLWIGIQDVTEILSLVLSWDEAARHLVVDAEIDTIYGRVAVALAL